MTDKGKILEKIRKLLEKAQSTTFEEESNAFFEGARRLLLEYNLTEEDIPQDSQSTIEMKCVILDPVKSRIKWWKKVILRSVCDFYLCKLLVSTDDSRYTWVVGRKHNIEIATQMYHSLVNRLLEYCEQEYQQSYRRGEISTRPGYTHPRTWKQVFLSSAAKQIAARLDLLSKQSDTSTLALVRTFEIEVQSWIDEELIVVRTVSPTYKIGYAPGAKEAGRTAGETIELQEGLYSSHK